jgi:predicted transcriptional regulator
MDNLDANNPIKEYTGVWIPVEVMESEELEPLDKLVYGEIASFRECYGSNEWLAKRVKRSVRTVIGSVNKLVELGFVERSGFNGRFRMLRCAVFRTADMQNSAQQTCQILHTENKVKNKVKNNGGKPQNEAVENSDKKEYGNHEVNALLELWEHETGIIANVGKANRIAAYNLIRKKGFDGAKAVVELCGRAIRSGDRYAPKVSSFRDLQGQYEKLSKLEAWEARQDTAEQGISVDFYCRDEYEAEEISDEERAKVLASMKKARAEMPFLRRKGGER